MKKLCLIARILLGLLFFASGLFGLLNPEPPPEGVPEAALDFSKAMQATGYFFAMVKLTEVVCGLFLLVGRFVPLALIVLAPIVLNIVLFHAFLMPSGIAAGLVALVLGVFLAWCYRASFRGVLAAKATPSI